MAAEGADRIDLVVRDAGDLRTSRVAVAVLAALGEISVDDAVLATSELVTNALTYGDGPCRVLGRLSRAGRHLRVEVVDGSPAALPPPTSVPMETVSGRGLAIVDQVVSRWGVHAADGIGKVVWFELDAPSSPTPG